MHCLERDYLTLLMHRSHLNISSNCSLYLTADQRRSQRKSHSSDEGASSCCVILWIHTYWWPCMYVWWWWWRHSKVRSSQNSLFQQSFFLMWSYTWCNTVYMYFVCRVYAHGGAKYRYLQNGAIFSFNWCIIYTVIFDVVKLPLPIDILYTWSPVLYAYELYFLFGYAKYSLGLNSIDQSVICLTDDVCIHAWCNSVNPDVDLL